MKTVAATHQFSQSALRVGLLSIAVFAVGEIIIVSTFYLHEPLAWPFILQGVAMLLGAVAGGIIGTKKRWF
jgi:uncharacterized protein (DUF486 family)